MTLFVNSTARAPAAVRDADRTVDGIAALLLVMGIALFALGRQALTAMANGSYPAPLGETWVARADFHANQTRWGVWFIAAGVFVALIAAARHAWHRRASARSAATAATAEARTGVGAS